MISFTASLNNYVPSQADILRMANDNRGPVMEHMKQIGRVVTAAARAQVGKETGELARSIHWRMGRWAAGLPETWVGTYNDIAFIHHEGTRPHAISARGAQFLRFSAKGRIVYDRTVMHPGTKPNRFLTDNIYLARL
ncbi:hypothetical protein SEA_BIG4_83 [Microbacterium phage Big4]|nr:hypothetical protein SEA_BIG4_83 [Microbacterium phage Big4]